MSAAKRDENYQVALILQNTAGTNVVYPTGVVLTNSTPLHVALVDTNGAQIGVPAAALADATANPTLTQIETFPTVFNGTTWDRLLGASATLAGSTFAATGVAINALAVFEGANTWRVLQEALGTSDTVGTTNGIYTSSRLMGYNGTNWDRLRSGSQANVTAATGFLSTFPVGIYNSTAPTVTNGKFNSLQIDANANLQSNLATLISGEDQTNNRMLVMPSYSYNNMTTQTTTTVKSGAGVLHAIVFNKPLAAGTVTIYDNTAGSGTLIGTITFPATLLSDVTDAVYDVAFSTGLTIVTAGATQDITIAYK